MDYLDGDPARAKTYMAEGEPIFDAVDARRQDIDNRFGSGVTDRLLKLRTQLHDALRTS
jgi:hypothetical protein